MSRMKAMLEAQEQWTREHADDFRADGSTFDPEQDGARLGKQAQAVWNLMAAGTCPQGTVYPSGGWWRLSAISKVLDYPEASISARLRDFRKPRFGSHTVERRRRKDGKGTWEYRLRVSGDEGI